MVRYFLYIYIPVKKFNIPPFKKIKNEIHWIFPKFVTYKISMTIFYKWSLCKYWHSFSTIKCTSNQIISWFAYELRFLCRKKMLHDKQDLKDDGGKLKETKTMKLFSVWCWFLYHWCETQCFRRRMADFQCKYITTTAVSSMELYLCLKVVIEII